MHTSLIVHLGWTLIHFLWQAALVWMLYICLRRSLQNATPQIRYCLALVTMLVLALLPLATFFYLSAQNTQYHPPQVASPIELTSSILGTLPGNIPQALDVRIAPLASWAVVLWLTGVLLMGMRALWGWRQVSSLRRTVPPIIVHPWQPLLHALLESMHVKGIVQLMASTRVHAPMVIGWLKPVILVPPSAACGLSWRQAEMILAHELAHIRRHDYLFNLLQVAVETLLFYHPVVHWISRDARSEREFCCDDVVMRTSGDRIGYLKALAELEGWRLQPSLGMGVNGGTLLRRAYRLAHRSEPVVRLPTWFVVLLALTALITVTAAIRGQSQAHALQADDSSWTQDAALISVPSGAKHAQQPSAGRPTPAARAALAPTRIGFAPMARSLARIEPLRISQPFQALNLVASLPVPKHVARQAAENPIRPTLNVVVTHPLPQPAYPYAALRDGLDGAVQASFRIGETGDVKDINTEMLSGPVALASAVRAAISGWRFQPVQSGNRIIAPRVSLSFVFMADTAHKNGHCVTFTGSHVCHWYQVTIRDFRTQDAAGNIYAVTPSSGNKNIPSEQVVVKLASATARQPVFCQPDFNGCSVADSAEHRQQIEHQIDMLRAGLIPGF